MKNSFILYLDLYEGLSFLDDESLGQTMRMVFQYLRGEELIKEPSPEAIVAFNFIKPHLDRNSKKYDEIIEKRRIAGRLGGLKSSNVKASKSKQMLANASKWVANQADNVNDNVNVIKKENKKKEISPIVDNSKEKVERDFTREERKFIFDELSKQSLLEKKKYGR